MITELITEIIQPDNEELIEIRIIANKTTPDRVLREMVKIGEKQEIAFLKGWAAAEKSYGIKPDPGDHIEREQNDYRRTKSNSSKVCKGNFANNPDENNSP